MKLAPSAPAAGLNLGYLLRDQKRLVEAEAACRRAVKADPHFAPSWHNLADLLDDGGRLAEAVDCEQRALDADPGYADAIFNMALFLQRLRRAGGGAAAVAPLSGARPRFVLGGTRQARIEVLRNPDGECGIGLRIGREECLINSLS